MKEPIWVAVEQEFPLHHSPVLVTIKSLDGERVGIATYSNGYWAATLNPIESITHWTDIPRRISEKSNVRSCKECNGAPETGDYSADNVYGTYCLTCNEVISRFDSAKELGRILPAGHSGR